MSGGQQPEWGFRRLVRTFFDEWASEAVEARVDGLREEIDRLKRRNAALTAELAQVRAEQRNQARAVGELTLDVKGLAVGCEVLSEDLRAILEPEVEAGG